MKLDLQEINHNYITRLLIFAAFLFKNQINKQEQYKKSILSFIEKRFPHIINISIEFPELSVSDKRDANLNQILFDDENELNYIYVRLETSFKEIILKINLNEEEKYELYLYG